MEQNHLPRFSVAYFAALLVVLHILVGLRAYTADSVRREMVRGEYSFSYPENQKLLPRIGRMQLLSGEYAVSQDEARQEISSLGRGMRALYEDDQLTGYLSMAMNEKDYFSNSFFKGFAPFPLQNPWLVLTHLRSHLKYKFDNRHFGYGDVWLTAKDTFYRRKGDCEDHSILMADWLITSGYDARVVTGTYKTHGHAWVVLFYDDQVFLLDTTRRTLEKRPPLAEYFPHYHPSSMFNHEYLWKYRGPSLHPEYMSESWHKAARFVETAASVD